MAEYTINRGDVHLDVMGNIIAKGLIEYTPDPQGLFPISSHSMLSIGRLNRIQIGIYSGSKENDLSFFPHQAVEQQGAWLTLGDELSNWIRLKLQGELTPPPLNSWQNDTGLLLNSPKSFDQQELCNVKATVSYNSENIKIEVIGILRGIPKPKIYYTYRPKNHWNNHSDFQKDFENKELDEPELKLTFWVNHSTARLLYSNVGDAPETIPYKLLSPLSGDGEDLSLARLNRLDGKNVVGYCDDGTFVVILPQDHSHWDWFWLSRFRQDGKEISPRLELGCLSTAMVQNLLQRGSSPEVRLEYSGAETGSFRSPTEHGGSSRRIENRVGALKVKCKLTRRGLEMTIVASGYSGSDIPYSAPGTKTMMIEFVVPWEGVIAHLPRLANCRTALLET